MLTLRPYQETAVQAIREEYRAGKKSVLFVLPTGGGKTVIFSYIAENARKIGTRVCICVHRRELLKQASDSLRDMGVHHGRIAPGIPQTASNVQVASVQTLVRRKHLDFDLLVFDEGHHATAGTWETITKRFPKARILGVTATPCRMTGKGLGDVYQSMVIGPTMKELIELGFLCKPQIWSPSTIDISALRSRGGDYAKDMLSNLMDNKAIIGDCVEQYTKICRGAPAIAFCVSVKHAEHVAEQFRLKGYTAASVDGVMKTPDRDGRIRDLGTGALNVLTSCDLISEGVDVPVVGGAILLRPTKSLSLYLQQVGRVLRPAPNKPHATILDHVGNVFRHGPPDMPRDWSLEKGAITPESKKEDGGIDVRTCDKCYLTHLWEPVCPNCGFEYPKREREIHEIKGDLTKLPVEEFMAAVGGAQTFKDLYALQKRNGKSKKWLHGQMRKLSSRKLEASRIG